jgi:hypothetical protein
MSNKLSAGGQASATSQPDFIIRPARREDCATIASLVRDVRDAMSGLESRPNSSTLDEPELADQVEHAEANAAYARAMHHRQILRRTLIAGTIVAILIIATLVGIPVARQVKAQWFLQAQGFTVYWDLDADNWTTGGVTSVAYHHQLWWSQPLDSAIPTLSSLLNLETLNLSGCPVSEQSLQALAQLTDLKELDLSRLFRHQGVVPSASPLQGPSELRLSDACLLPLVNLPRLRKLYLSGNRITDKGLEQIGLMAGLDDLDLSATNVTDHGLVHLQSLSRLKSLNLAATLVTPEGIKALQKALPGVEISQDIDPELE